MTEDKNLMLEDDELDAVTGGTLSVFRSDSVIEAAKNLSQEVLNGLEGVKQITEAVTDGGIKSLVKPGLENKLSVREYTSPNLKL